MHKIWAQPSVDITYVKEGKSWQHTVLISDSLRELLPAEACQAPTASDPADANQFPGLSAKNKRGGAKNGWLFRAHVAKITRELFKHNLVAAKYFSTESPKRCHALILVGPPRERVNGHRLHKSD